MPEHSAGNRINALVQYRFLFPRFSLITLLQTGHKWHHLWWCYYKQRHIFAEIYRAKTVLKYVLKTFKMGYVIKRILHSCSLHIVFMKRVYYNDMTRALASVIFIIVDCNFHSSIASFASGRSYHQNLFIKTICNEHECKIYFYHITHLKAFKTNFYTASVLYISAKMRRCL